MLNSKKEMSAYDVRPVWMTGVFALALMAGTAFASQSLVQDRRLSMSAAQEMAARVKSESGFPIVVNDLVLKELNRYVGTPDGREYMRKALQRMENYRTLVDSKIRQYQVPSELAAIPIVESGYQNLEPQHNPVRAAGVWQFIASTARNFGLRVDSEVDERMNPELETDAGMRYLKGNHLVFNDWLLSVLAYNLGENQVQKAIRATGSRDAWAIVRAGYENDKSYLPRVMAAVLILKNPESVAQ